MKTSDFWNGHSVFDENVFYSINVQRRLIIVWPVSCFEIVLGTRKRYLVASNASPEFRANGSHL